MTVELRLDFGRWWTLGPRDGVSDGGTNVLSSPLISWRLRLKPLLLLSVH